MTQSLIIHPTTDWAAIAAVHAAIPDFGDRPDAAHFAARCEGADGRGYIATMETQGNEIRSEAQPGGYVVAYDRYGDGSYYCWMAGTVPAFRRHGVLSALMHQMETDAQQAGYQRIRIKTRMRWRAMRQWLRANEYMVTTIDKRRPLADSRIELVKELSRNH